MPKHAPTLFIGLGGSGVKVVRWVRQAIYDGLPQSQREAEPVAFLGIDFDASSNEAKARLDSLAATEFRYYDPASIAATVNNIDRERPAPTDVVPQAEEHWEFPEIREWYPDPEQNAIRYAQTEATGAAQWRPLGRIGFFLNDREIHDALAEGLTDLDRRRAASVKTGEHPTVVIVSSIAGGTGSAILFDVAVAIRKIRRGVSVRIFLLLPELFDHIDFRDRVFPNSYATLWEVAALKNQHVVFHARYPRIPPVTRSDSPPPFQRVYLVGPWVGDRKPFTEPDEIFPFVAQLLRMSTTREIRAAALSAEANASADSGAPLSDPTSLHVFCAMSAMAIRLLSYAELADLFMRQFLEELNPEGERPLLDVLAGGRIGTRPLADIVEWIETTAGGNDEAFAVTEAYRELELARFMREHASYRSFWRAADLQKIRQDLRRFCGTDSSAPMDEPPELLDRIRNDFATRLEERLAELAERHHGSPRAFEGLLTQLERRLPEVPARKPLPDLQSIENFERWLDTGQTWASLAQQLTPAHLDRLEDEARRWLATEPKESDYRLWLRQAITSAARKAIGKLRAAEDARWEKVAELRSSAQDLLAAKADPVEERREQIYLDGRNANAALVLQHELARFDKSQARAFHRELMKEFFAFYDDYRITGDEITINTWIANTRRLFERQLAGVGSDDPEASGTRYTLLSPESLFTEKEVTSALLRCRNRIFHPGRVASPAALRVARLLVPDGFRSRNGYAAKMRNWTKGLLNASTSSLQADGSAGENRIVVVVEDLFHPAEDISGIYDYYAHYTAQPNRLLFHIHRQWPSLFPDLITRAGDRTRVQCGNPDCKADIRTVPRTTLFCPGCDQPIRNRCGNAGCPENGLADRRDLDKAIASRTCPACGGFLWTSWWRCTDHDDVPIDKPNCPHCVRDGRAAHRISRRPDRLNRFTCPGCVARKIAPPFSVSGDAARYLLDGVDGHDLIVAQAELRTLLARAAYCPQCGTQLAPICPEADTEHPGRPHYLYRHRDGSNVDRFRCYLHTHLEFQTCGHCEFMLPSGATRCGRCGTELTDCRFCTLLFGIRIPASTDLMARCPNCYTRQPANMRLANQKGVQPADPDEWFCSNLFGCPAGGHLHDTTFPPNADACPLCRSQELPLLHAFAREEHLRACRFCSSLFGIKRHDEEPATETTAGDADGHCCLCGRLYAADAKLSAADRETDETDKTDEKIGCVLRCTTDDEEAFRLLLERLPVTERAILEQKLLAFLDHTQRAAVKRVVAARLARILALYDRQFGCRLDRTDRRSSPCDC